MRVFDCATGDKLHTRVWNLLSPLLSLDAALSPRRFLLVRQAEDGIWQLRYSYGFTSCLPPTFSVMFSFRLIYRTIVVQKS